MNDGPPVATNLEEANAIIAVLWAQIAELRERVRELELRLSQSSSNSSRPPSSDPPWRPRKPPETPSGRTPGGQAGHAGHGRTRTAPTQVVDHYPDRCVHCGADFDGTETADDPREHEVVDIPDIEPTVTVDRMWRRRCKRCGKRTRYRRQAEAGPKAPATPYGPRLQSAIVTLTGRNHMSRSAVVETCQDLFGAKISVGATQRCCERMSAAMAPVAEAVHADVLASQVVCADETSWRERRADRKRSWLWTATTQDAEYFLIDAGRGNAARDKIVPASYEGVVSSDGWHVYDGFQHLERQLCHAHERRHFQALIDRGGEAKVIGEDLLLASNAMFSVWHRFKSGAISYAAMRTEINAMRPQWRALIDRALKSPDRKARARGKHLDKHFWSLWTFTVEPQADPTNNAAERALRKAVLWRKTSGGTRSNAGARFVERIITIGGTARRRHIPLFDWLTRLAHTMLIHAEPPFLRSG